MTILPLALALLTAQNPANQVKGQQQLAGSTAAFGTTYTLQNKFNFTLLSAEYGLAALDAQFPLLATDERKLLTLQFSIKNADGGDNWLNTEGLFTLVDDKDQVYTENGLVTLQSLGAKAPNLTLRPGQGLGAPAQKDPLAISFTVPAKARITKIMVNLGRLQTPSEKVLRFLLNPPPKSKDEKVVNLIKSLPPEAADASDPWGALRADAGKGTPGQFLPSGAFDIRLDGVANPADVKLDGNPAEEGKKYVVATITAVSRVTPDFTTFELSGGDDPKHEIVDADNEHYKPVAFLKPKADEAADHKFVKGEPYAVRIVFLMPKDAQPKKLLLGAGSSMVWQFGF